jgi:hypothetical protein
MDTSLLWSPSPMDVLSAIKVRLEYYPVVKTHCSLRLFESLKQEIKYLILMANATLLRTVILLEGCMVEWT